MSEFQQNKVKDDRQYGRRVLLHRRSRKLSQDDLAQQIGEGVTRRMIQRVEDGRGCDRFLAGQIESILAAKPVRL